MIPFRVSLIKGERKLISDQTDQSLSAAIDRAVTDLTEHPDMGPGYTGDLHGPFPRAEITLGKGIVATVEMKKYTEVGVPGQQMEDGDIVQGVVFKITRNT